jgi:hypothetical protein
MKIVFHIIYKNKNDLPILWIAVKISFIRKTFL